MTDDAKTTNPIGTTMGDKPVMRSEAMGLFGEMRHSTEEEMAAYRRMLDGMGVPIGIDIYDLPSDGTPVTSDMNIFDIIDKEGE